MEGEGLGVSGFRIQGSKGFRALILKKQGGFKDLIYFKGLHGFILRASHGFYGVLEGQERLCNYLP